VPLKRRTLLAFIYLAIALPRAAPTRLPATAGGAPMDGSQQRDLDQYAKHIIREKAKRLIEGHGFGPDDYEDLQQELALDLLMRLPKFDSARSCLKTFVVRIVNHKVREMIRHRTQQKRDHRRCVCSLDDPLEQDDGSTILREETVSQDDYDLLMGKHSRPEVERTDLAIDVSRALSRIPPDLRDLAVLLVLQSKRDAAREAGISRSTLYKRGLRRLRSAFEDAGLRDYL